MAVTKQTSRPRTVAKQQSGTNSSIAARRKAESKPINTRHTRAVEPQSEQSATYTIDREYHKQLRIQELESFRRFRQSHRFDAVDIALAVSLAVNVIAAAWLASIVW